MTPQDDKEYAVVFALKCQIPNFMQLPGDIQRGLVDIVMRIGCVDFACFYFLKTCIEAGNLDCVKSYLIHLNKNA